LISFSIRIMTPDERRTTLLRTLRSTLGAQPEWHPGCPDARFYSDLDNRNTLLFVEEWESRLQFERNLDVERLNTIVAAIELSSEVPPVRVDTVEREVGLDTLGFHRSGFSG
jgi:quinol monooxygenase YgiN